MLPGIDVSNHQAQIDWDAVAASGQGFAICKATQGNTFVDPWFLHNWSELARVGLVRGAYCYVKPSLGPPEPQAEFFLQVVSSAGGLRKGDLLALDIEDPDVDDDDGLADWCLTWLRYVEDRVGFKPLIYSRPSYLEPHGMTGDARLAEYGLWLASYRDTMPSPPALWPFIAIWQHSEEGSVPGVSGNCDENYFNGLSADQLRLYGFQGDVWPTPVAPAPTPEVPTSEPAGVTLSAAEVQEMRAAIQELRERVTYIERFLVID